MAANYADVLSQLQAAGLQVDHLELGKLRRCRADIDGQRDREKRGWYILHEIVASDGQTLIVGSYGIWSGTDNRPQKVQIRGNFTRDQLDSMRRRIAEDQKRAERARRARAERAAAQARKAWAACSPTGEAEYLRRKGVAAYGIRFSPSGAVVIPLLDTAGQVHGLQVIRTASEADQAKRPAKEFWPAGVTKRGHFHLIGLPSTILLLCEGYATGATLHAATSLPTAIAFDAGNLVPVAQALHKRYPQAKILICADDDAGQKCQHRPEQGAPRCGARVWLPDHPLECPTCGNLHLANNAGVTTASGAALEVAGAHVQPRFASEAKRAADYLARGVKLTDFNDLHAAEGLHVVRAQIEARISELGWRTANAARVTAAAGGAGKAPLRKITSVDELLERYTLVYGQGGTVFDHEHHKLVSLSDMRDLCTDRRLHRAWAEHPDASVVDVREVGFDPGGEDPTITCNLWGGWPTEPAAGDCSALLQLLRHMCSADPKGEDLFNWLVCWLAYPIQHPGAKMKTSVVVHGPQGTGKNLFWEAYMAIYGPYGRAIDQSAIEDRFNDWASRKLFLIADEVLARSEVYHVKNKLKSFITGDWIRINPKNLAAYDERNHVNLVFLSNEDMPVVLEEDDRRHCVIRTPDKMPADFYAKVAREIESGGIAALHHYLLHHDCGAFGPNTKPLVSEAKRDLIGLSLDSTVRFYRELAAGDVGDFRLRDLGAALVRDVYDLYRIWCSRVGVSRAAPETRFSNALQKRLGVEGRRARWLLDAQEKGPNAFVMIGEISCPDGTPEGVWLGRQVSAWRARIDEYKGTTHG